jgi:acyl-CoA synthetase (AMP-forming)/AMP-acid ligase II
MMNIQLGPEFESQLRNIMIAFFGGFMMGAVFIIITYPMLFSPESELMQKESLVYTQNPETAKITRTDTYWKVAARPFIIPSTTLDSSFGKLALVLQNKDTETYILEEVLVRGEDFDQLYTIPGQQGQFPSGTSKEYSFKLPYECHAGDLYEFDLELTYTDTAGELKKKEVGDQPVRGRCI